MLSPQKAGPNFMSIQCSLPYIYRLVFSAFSSMVAIFYFKINGRAGLFFSIFESLCMEVSRIILEFGILKKISQPQNSELGWLSYHHHNRIFDLHAGARASSTSVGPLPGNWLAACIADLTPDLQVLLSWGSTVVSFHSWQSFSVSFFYVSLGLPTPCLPSICISHAVLTAPLEGSICPNQRSLLSLSNWGRGPQAQVLPVQ